jgi:hypothetical protein
VSPTSRVTSNKIILNYSSKFEKDKLELAEKCRLLLNQLNEANKKIAETEKVLSNNVTELSEMTKEK